MENEAKLEYEKPGTSHYGCNWDHVDEALFGGFLMSPLPIIALLLFVFSMNFLGFFWDAAAFWVLNLHLFLDLRIIQGIKKIKLCCSPCVPLSFMCRSFQTFVNERIH